jgi:P-type Ca2+ transporter type 2C
MQLQGLTQAQAEQRLQKDGPNALPDAQRRSLWQRMRDLLSEPMFALLVIAALFYVLLGDLLEGITLAIFVIAVLALTFYQEGRSENAIEALQALSQPMARVIRAGTALPIPARELVEGDLLLISEGDRVSADAVLLSSDHLQIDESLLTGESVPVEKQAPPDNPNPATAPPEVPSEGQVFSGTFVIKGQAVARVTATGPRSQIGRIGASLSPRTAAATPLQAQTARLVRVIASIAAALCVGLVLVLVWREGQWVPALLSGIALAMAILPEEYSVVLTIFPALGARRLAREGVLTRRITAIETLGAINVLCTDKTGTLTHNRMTVTALAAGAGHEATVASWSSANNPVLSEEFHTLLEHAILASAPAPFDPMEAAFHALGQAHLAQTEHLHRDWTLVQTYALSPTLKAMSHVWQFDAGPDRVVSAKGAPEAVMDLCHLSPAQRAHWSMQVELMARQGLRVLAVAQGRFTGNDWPAHSHDFDFEWLGLIGLTDPLRPEIPQAVADCHHAGIRVIMITGDYPATARVIASQAGLGEGQTLTGDELDQLSDSALCKKILHVNVCARITPNQKLRIVQALQANGSIVAMTGDGVNDAPALRAAHVGIAMGERGTDVAREAASIVLMDDNFASIVKGIRWGRQIFDNLQKSMRYIFAIHIPIVGMALLPLLVGWPPLLLPVHLALLELVIDPACAIAFENEPAQANVMKRPPRDILAPLFGWTDMTLSMAQGLCVLFSLSLGYLWASQHVDEASTRALLFATLVLANAGLLMGPRTFMPHAHECRVARNPITLWIIGLNVCALLMALNVPWSLNALHFAALQPQAWAVVLACSAVSWLGVWTLSRVVRSRANQFKDAGN